MSQENVEIVRAMLTAYMGSDEPALRALLTPEVVLSARPDQPDARDHFGYEGLMRMSAEWVEAWEGHTIEELRTWDAGDHVFVQTRETGLGRTSGIPIDTESTFVFTVREGKIVRMQIFGSEHEAAEAVGPAE